MMGPSTAVTVPLLALRARRIDRLRDSGGIGKHHPRAIATTRPADVAAALGGALLPGSGGRVVVIDASGPLPLPRDALGRLPDPVEPGRPLVCLDTETTGLGTSAGTLPFLIGLGVWDGDRFSVRQLLLSDHAAEPEFLAAVRDAIPPDAWLVTYNGRSFDWPLMVTRFRLHHHPPPAHAGHLDLLPLARQLWRHRLPDARLCSVEAGVCGVVREADLPGALIPERYFAFLRHGRAESLLEVVRHNRQDVASLARLLLALSRCLDPHAWPAEIHPGDLHGLGRAYVRRRRYTEALTCFEAALATALPPSSLPTQEADPSQVPVSQRAAVDRARTLARMGRHDEAARVWAEIASQGDRLAAIAWIQVAKRREHHDGDPTAALAAAGRAAELALRGRAAGNPVPWVERDLCRRLPRLRAAAARGVRAAAARALPSVA